MFCHDAACRRVDLDDLVRARHSLIHWRSHRHVEAATVGAQVNAAQSASDLNRSDHAVARRVDDGDRAVAFVADVTKTGVALRQRGISQQHQQANAAQQLYPFPI